MFIFRHLVWSHVDWLIQFWTKMTSFSAPECKLVSDWYTSPLICGEIFFTVSKITFIHTISLGEKILLITLIIKEIWYREVWHSEHNGQIGLPEEIQGKVHFWPIMAPWRPIFLFKCHYYHCFMTNWTSCRWLIGNYDDIQHLTQLWYFIKGEVYQLPDSSARSQIWPQNDKSWPKISAHQPHSNPFFHCFYSW